MAQRPAQPNFLLVYADDLGWQDPKVYDNMETNVVNGFGGTNVFETPYMDALAREGVLFTQAYSPQCVCAPSRAAILSGQAPARLNFITVSGGAICPQPSGVNSRMIGAYHNRRLEVDEITLPGVLSSNGYFNGHIGKWHLAGPGPLDHHFHVSEGSRGVTRGMANRLTGFATTNSTDAYQLQDINGNASTNGYAFDQMTQNGLDFLADAVTNHSNQPFFCYFATWLVHAPWHQRTERLLKKYALRMGYSYPLDGTETFAPGQNNPYYAAMVETFDYNLHQLLNYLRNTDDPRWPGHKLIENTYIFLTSDNGGMENGDPQGKVTDNYPLDEGKIREEEGGTRVPFLAVGPGIPSNRVSDVMINGLDLMPTILSLAGASIPSGLDGLNLSPLLLTDPTDAQLVTNEVGEVRDTMYWHFNKGTIRKRGWKLFLNYDQVHPSQNPYRLYQLYDTNGVPVDLNEATDLWDDPAYTNVTEELASELKTWLADVGANTPFYNPNYGPQDLPNQELVPSATGNGRTGDVVWVEYETNRAEVVRVDLLYTREGDRVQQDWFRMPASITGPGRAEVTPPAGTTHYVFNLIDENNFLVSYPEVGTIGDKIPDSAFAFSLLNPVYVNPGPQDTLFYEDFSTGSLGTSFTRDSVGFQKGGSSAWTINGGVMRNDSPVNNAVSEGAVGVIIDLSSLTDTSVDQFTLGFDYTMAEFTEALYVHVWGYVDHSSTPGTSIMNTGAQNGNAWENASPDYMTGYNFGNPNGVFIGTEGTASDAAISQPGFFSPKSYAKTFDLSGYTSAPNTLAAYDYLVVGFARSIAGSAPAVTIDNVKVTVPTGDKYALWAYDTGLNIVAADAAARLNTVTPGGLARDNVGWRKAGDSAWTVTDGVLANSSLSNNNVAEGAIARVFDLDTFPELDGDQLSLRFDYSAGDAAEDLVVHLWGYVENATPSTPSTFMMNLGASNGNAWESTGETLDQYNLGYLDGVWTNNGSLTKGEARDAALILTGLTGDQSISTNFDLSANTQAPSLVSGFDYLVLGFARDIGGASSPAVAISNVVLSVPGGDTILNFVQGLPLDDLMANPDSDNLVNLLEFALGGNPVGGTDAEVLPVPRLGPGGAAEFVFRRRINRAVYGLEYIVQCDTNLVEPVWSTNGCREAESVPIDSAFERVTTILPPGRPIFGRLGVSLGE